MIIGYIRKVGIIFLLVFAVKAFSAEYIVLIHGINDTSRGFRKMEKHFSADYKVININYPSLKYSIPDLSDKYLKPVMDKIANTDTINIVTHSMGAIILREYFKDNHPTNINRIVMISPPNQGSEVADFFHNFFLYKWIYAKAGSSLSQAGLKNLILPDSLGYDCGIIAGTGTLLPFFSIFIKGKDDGKISENRTKLPDMKDFITLHYSHDFIAKRKKTIKYTEHFLKYGKFKDN